MWIVSEINRVRCRHLCRPSSLSSSGVKALDYLIRQVLIISKEKYPKHIKSHSIFLAVLEFSEEIRKNQYHKYNQSKFKEMVQNEPGVKR